MQQPGLHFPKRTPNSNHQVPTGNWHRKPGCRKMKWDQMLFSKCQALPRTTLEASSRQHRGAKLNICSQKGSQATTRTSASTTWHGLLTLKQHAQLFSVGRRNASSARQQDVPFQTYQPWEESTHDICTLALSQNPACLMLICLFSFTRLSCSPTGSQKNRTHNIVSQIGCNHYHNLYYICWHSVFVPSPDVIYNGINPHIMCISVQECQWTAWYLRKGLHFCKLFKFSISHLQARAIHGLPNLPWVCPRYAAQLC